MCSYNGINGSAYGVRSSHPMCMSPFLEGILRKKWSFGGYIVTDSGAIDFMVTEFKRFSTKSEAAAAAIKAGVDLNSGGNFDKPLLQAVKNGLVSEKDHIDVALHRVLHAKIRMGLFNEKDQDPFSGYTEEKDVNSNKHREVALKAARASLVLLRNENNTLPLKGLGTIIKKIAVIGPAANDTLRMAGNYYGCSFGTWGGILPGCGVKTPYQGLKDELAKLDPSVSVEYTIGTEQNRENRTDFSQATELAQNTDVTIVFVGLKNCHPNVENGHRCESEGKDRPDLLLPGSQHQLLKSLHQTGKPIILVLSSGGPVSLYWEAQHMHAIIASWYGGTMGGVAVAQLLFGQFSPSGKLPVTFPTNMTQVAPPLGMDLTDQPGRTYRYLTQKPLYTFGHGLSYSKLTLSNLTFHLANETDGRACFQYQNHGPMISDFIVMSFVSYLGETGNIPSVPLKQLVGFEKLADVQVSALPTRQCIPVHLRFAHLKKNRQQGAMLQPGRYKLFVGTGPPGSPGLFVSADDSSQNPLELEFHYDTITSLN
mmetsp:Transcript_17701/g.30059  ORF Transcript_17701/g.30059 Transcript_17701/m.30059 type:complete len:539 (-) Transcript_17701:1684-3300(-)